MNFRSAYSEPVRVTSDPEGVSLTEQAHKDACDTSRIVRRYLKNGVVDHLNTARPLADGEVPLEMDFKTAMDVVARGNSVFAELPASLRAQFDHDAAAFVAFATNPENTDKLVEMGLADAPIQAPTAQSIPTLEGDTSEA